jgi:transmembrane sensor
MASATEELEEDLPRLARAAAWRVTLFDADLETSEEFETWLELDPRNREAWVRVQGPWSRFGEEAAAPELVAARQRALDGALRHHEQRHAPRLGSIARAGLVAASVAVLVAPIGVAGVALWRQAHATQSYQTALGERRTVTLKDGSHIDLDSGTLVRVSLRRHAREVEFLRGQARFDVAHDSRRPFTVHVRDQTVLATGTSFNVDLLGSRLLVTLIEGRVSILKDQLPPRSPTEPSSPHVVARLVAGDQMVAGASPTGGPVLGVTPIKVAKVDVDKATAWVTGQLVFEDETLRTVAERVSRYSGHPVRADGLAADLRISGVFNSGDISTFVDAAQRMLPVRAEMAEDDSIHLRSATGN